MASGKDKTVTTIKQILPWLGTFLLLGYLACTTDLDTVSEAVMEADILLLIAVALAGTLATFFTDTWCVKLAFTRFVCPVTYKEALPIKATSYFLNVLNYNVALVGMAFYLKKAKDAPFWRSLGAMFFLNVMDIVALCVMLCGGLLATWGDDTLDVATRAVAWTIVGGGITGFSISVVLLKLNLPIPIISRMMKLEILQPLADLDFKTLGMFVLLRILFLSQYLLSQWAFLYLFGIEVPGNRLLVYLPLLTFVQIVPISISGLGTVQLVMRRFYSRYVTVATQHTGAIVDAFSTTAILGFMIFRIVIAYFYLGDLSREVIQKAGSINADEQEPNHTP